MKLKIFFASLLVSIQVIAAPRFISAEPMTSTHYEINGPVLCKTATETLAYLNKGKLYDPRVIHAGKVFRVPLARVKATLAFICQHQNELQDPAFVKKHFNFVRWYPDLEQTKFLKVGKPLIANLPNDKILMTKYYVPRAKVSYNSTASYPYALHGLPKDEEALTLEEANATAGLIRFQYGKQAILNGALANKNIPALAYLKRDDLEAALMQGTIVADFPNNQSKLLMSIVVTMCPMTRRKIPINKNATGILSQ